ncbi:MAG TPA: hypothetical protein VKQ29_17680 [Aliidongia sp.]|nr:hypothetical protein [Aliidongia sp.]
MTMAIFRVAAVGLLAIMCAGCQPNVSPDTYSVGAVGQANRTVRGMIISARAVAISGTQSGIGAGAGAAAGGVAGSHLGGNGTTAAIGAIGGVIAGGIVGAMAEDAATRQGGMEYVVQTENGALLTVVQGAQPALSQSQKVLVIYGSRSRVIADPSA